MSALPTSGPMSGWAKPTSGPLWRPSSHVGSDVGFGQTDVGPDMDATLPCRIRRRVGPTRHGLPLLEPCPPPSPCENIKKTYETDSLTCRTRCRPMYIPCQRGPYMSGPMSAYVYPMSGPLSIWCFTCRVLCRPMCILCRILCEMAYPCRVLCRPYVGPMSACL